MRDRRATPRQVAAAHRRLKKRNGGPGLELAAQRLGVSGSYLCSLLQGLVPPGRRLKLSDLRRLQDGDPR